jgi:peptidoglycan/xylan/chitin deacetylase (PgdA/CDA1 family)
MLAHGAAAWAQPQTSNRNVRREVAVTFDDLPEAYAGGQGDVARMREVTKKLVQSIKANNVPAIGFVNEGKLYQRGEVDARIELLRMWLDAGLELGNHNFSHAYIDRVPLAAYQEEIVRGETVTRMLLRERGLKLKYYRHTELKTGPTPEHKRALEQFLAERGYTIAPVTIHNHDFVFARLYSDAKARGDRATMKRIADAYVPYMESMFEFFENLSGGFLGYEVKQTLVLHVNELNADYFDDLVRMMKRRGYSFITLGEALKDKAYLLPDAQLANGPSWIARWMAAKGMDVPYQPSEPGFIKEMFAARRR